MKNDVLKTLVGMVACYAGVYVGMTVASNAIVNKVNKKD